MSWFERFFGEGHPLRPALERVEQLVRTQNSNMDVSGQCYNNNLQAVQEALQELHNYVRVLDAHVMLFVETYVPSYAGHTSAMDALRKEQYTERQQQLLQEIHVAEHPTVEMPVAQGTQKLEAIGG